MGKLLPMMKPYLYQNGGPIITVQVSMEVRTDFLQVCCRALRISAVLNPLRKLHLPPAVPTFGRWKMNMAVISPVTTTTCVTCPSCSALTWARRWCSSPQTELGSATSSVAQYKVSTPLLTLGQVGVRCLDVLKVKLCVEATLDEVHLFVWFLFLSTLT